MSGPLDGEQDTSRPLAGIRVIDFGRFIAAPYCAMLLADFGADVIRVEQPAGGEDRFLSPVTRTGEGPMYLNLNRNKRGMTLALDNPAAAGVVRRLVEGADVVVVNLTPDVQAKAGLGWASLSAINPRLVMAVPTAFGPDGPRAADLGFDGVVQAMCGAMGLAGFGATPVLARVPFVDYTTALHAAFGVMVALHERETTGRGRLVDVSLLASGVAMMQALLAERVATGVTRGRDGNAGYWAAPHNAYQAGDGGWIVVQTFGAAMFGRWARLVGRPELAGDPRMADDESRHAHAAIVDEAMEAWCRGRTRDEALAELQASRVPAGPVLGLDEVTRDPQVVARGLLTAVPVPGAAKPVLHAPAAVRLGRGPQPIVAAAPALGEHTDAVLAELGYSGAEVAALRAAGAV